MVSWDGCSGSSEGGIWVAGLFLPIILPAGQLPTPSRRSSNSQTRSFWPILGVFAEVSWSCWGGLFPSLWASLSDGAEMKCLQHQHPSAVQWTWSEGAWSRWAHSQAESWRSSHGGKQEVKRAGTVLSEGQAEYNTDVAGCYLWLHSQIGGIWQDHCRCAEPMAAQALQPERGVSTSTDHRGAWTLTPDCSVPPATLLCLSNQW